MRFTFRTGALALLLAVLGTIACQPVTHSVSVPAHGQGGAVTVRKLPPRPPEPLPPEVVKEQERKQTRLDELEARVKELEAENAELKRAATRAAP
jgi:1-acyl-sn-glycerol-3-phosphate acyltransferase